MGLAQTRLGDAVTKFQGLAEEAKRERIVSIVRDPDPTPLARTLLRIRNDFVILSRATVEPFPEAVARRLEPPLTRFGEEAAAFLRASADALASRTPPPPIAPAATALRAYGAEIAALRAEGFERTMASDDVERFFALGFALDETIPVHINFARNKYLIGDLDDTARHQLDEVAALLTSPEWRERRPVVVEGHACSCGSDAANLILGRKRAEAVLAYLVAKNALNQEDATAVSMGKSSPVVPSEHENLSAEACARDEAHNQNRRVIIRQASGSAAPLVTFWYRPVGAETMRPLTDGAVLYRKDEIRVKVQAPNPLFAYVVHHGPDNAWEVLYPRPGASDAALLPADARRDGHWIPGMESGFRVHGKSGDEEALVYLSAAPIPEFEARPKKANAVATADQAARLAPVPTPAAHGPAQTQHPGAAVKPVVGIDEEVRGLSAPVVMKLAGRPHAVSPAATVKFKSHD